MILQLNLQSTHIYILGGMELLRQSKEYIRLILERRARSVEYTKESFCGWKEEIIGAIYESNN